MSTVLERPTAEWLHFHAWLASDEGAAIYADLTGRLALLPVEPAHLTARRRREAIA